MYRKRYFHCRFYLKQSVNLMDTVKSIVTLYIYIYTSIIIDIVPKLFSQHKNYFIDIEIVKQNNISKNNVAD